MTADVASLRPLAAVAVSGLATAAILASARRPLLREGWTFLAAVAKLGLVASMVPGVLAGETYVTTLPQFLPGARLALRADALGTLFALVAATLWLVTSVYSVGYLRATDGEGRTRYFAAFAASLSATLAAAFAANLLTLLVAYELLSVATYPLVVHDGTPAARRAGRRYLGYTLAGGLAVFAGTLLVYALGGTVAFAPGGIGGLAGADPGLARAAFALLVAGFGVKAALFPLHAWLPAAMVAPTPVSGLLHAVAVVKTGAFGVARVVLFVFGPGAMRGLGLDLPLAVVAATTTTVAGLVALRQERLKRGLAYSTISQLSYIVLGLAVLAPAAVVGALLHLLAHAFMKITLFFCAGVVYAETGAERLDELRGVGRRLPLTMAAFAVGGAGLVGLPLVAGFVSKWYLLLGSVRAGSALAVAALLVAGLLKLLFFWPIVAGAFTGERGRWLAPPGGASGGTSESATTDGGNASTTTAGDADGSTTTGGGNATTATDGGDPPATADGGTGHAHGPPVEPDGWERRRWYDESTWLLLGPVVVALAVAVAFGVVPTALPPFDLAEAVVVEVFGP